MDVFHIIGQSVWSGGHVDDSCDLANVRRVRAFKESFPKPHYDGHNVDSMLQSVAESILHVGQDCSEIRVSTVSSFRGDCMFPMVFKEDYKDKDARVLTRELVDYLRYIGCKPYTSLSIQFSQDGMPELQDLASNTAFVHLARFMFKGIYACVDVCRFQLFPESAYDLLEHEAQLTRTSLAGYLLAMYNTQTYYNQASRLFRDYNDGLNMEVHDANGLLFAIKDRIIHPHPEADVQLFQTERTFTSRGSTQAETIIVNGCMLLTDQAQEECNRQNLDLFRKIKGLIVPDMKLTSQVSFVPNNSGYAVLSDKDNLVQRALSYVDMKDRAQIALGALNVSYPLGVIMQLHTQAMDGYLQTNDDKVYQIAQDMMSLWEAYWMLTHIEDKAKVSVHLASKAVARLEKGASFLKTIYGISINMEQVVYAI